MANYLFGLSFGAALVVIATALWARGKAPWWYALGMWASVMITAFIFSVHLK